MRRSTLGAAGAGVVVGLVLGVVGARLATDDDNDSAATTKRTTTVTVERRSLAVNETTTGELAAATEQDLTTIGSGTLTTAASVGAQLERGAVLARVDDRPVVLLTGEQPVWRSLSVGVDDGADVRQLEWNLVALGFDPGEVDDQFDSDTAAAVEHWESSLGLSDADGAVEAGEVVFTTSTVQVTEATAAGTRLAAGDTVATVRAVDGSGLRLTFTVTEEADRYQSGQPVAIITTDGTRHPATIVAFERVAQTGGGQPGGGSSSTSFTVTATPDAGDDALDPGPVDVEIPTEAADDVLAVPSRALVAVVEGGQAVELAAGGYRAVEVGVFADGWVEVSGDGITEGLKITVPA